MSSAGLLRNMWVDLEAFAKMQGDQESVVAKLRTCLEKVCAKQLQAVNAEADLDARVSKFISEILEGDALPAILDCASTIYQCNMKNLASEEDDWATLAHEANDVAETFLSLFSQMLPRIIDSFDGFCNVAFFSGPDKISINRLQRITKCIEAVGEQIYQESMAKITGAETTPKVFMSFWRQLEGGAGQFFCIPYYYYYIRTLHFELN